MWVVLLGPPGAGKGTQAQSLSARHCWLHLAMGDLLREAVAQGTALGKEAEGYMKQGSLVPDRIILGLIRKRITSSARITGCLFDGVPRNLSQAEDLESALQQEGKRLDRAIFLDVNEEALVRRLASRRICGRCNRVFNLLSSPSKAGDHCESCGSELQLRPDDCEETIRHRITVYREDTEPLKAYYERQGILDVISGDVPFKEVEDRIEGVLREVSLGR